ncbi:hypothetical protein LTR35_004501 [Friedmanniomyces endolithicus]|uniref:Uncharacterized protein n=1 Tax=Friedmanniomyces endolithicus TaxID=329885 RepID=A0AAN6JJB1_9PEZI|nr:hypothetical protein LTR35_004501 [Friedmanniomyces endolithicus]KAK0295627.1 hypothetical protein LTS00_005828 [Friedmanniomyces endolithicus]KAK0326414.1 hypothetical protein LTR82_002255 [Friedmanniomyces endolithicus]KAK0993349.1 hypothetical protein LTR54_011120 [Friedmanniomyces endolithicus]
MERREIHQAPTRHRPLAPPSPPLPGPSASGTTPWIRWERHASDPSTIAREGLRQGLQGERRERAGSIPETVARWLSDGSYQAHWPPPQSEHDGDLPRASGPSGSQVMGSFGLETAGLRQAVDHSELTPALLGAVDEHLKHFEDSLSTVSESEPGEEAANNPEEPPAQLPPNEDTDYQDFRRRHSRASSLPGPKPSLKSALATSPPHSPPAGEGGSGGREKKKARFQDDSPGKDLGLRRTSTAPTECGASSASDFPWSGRNEEADAGGREERAGSEVEGSEEGSEEGFAREDESPSSWVVQVQVQIETLIDDRNSLDDDLANGSRDGIEDVGVKTRVYSSGGGYDEVGESPAGEYDDDVKEAEVENSAAGVDDRDEGETIDAGEADTGTQIATVEDDRGMVDGEPCACDPDVEASDLAVENDEAGQNDGDDEGEQTAGDDEDVEVERDTAEAEEADETSDLPHHRGTDSSKCSREDADPDVDQDPRQGVKFLEIEQAAGDDENAGGDPASAEAEETDTTIDCSHRSCTDLSESLSKGSDQDNVLDTGQNDEEEAGAVGDAEDADEADSAHLSTASSGLSSKDDGQDEGPFLTPEENSFDEVSQTVMAAFNVSDDGPMPADEQSLVEGTELPLIMPAMDSTHTASPAQQQVPHRQNVPPTIRRLSDPDARSRQDPAPDPVRRSASSMSDFQHLKTRLKFLPFAAKAAPADPAITACSVRIAESPRLNTVYEHPDPQYGSRPAFGKGAATKTAQTVSSGRSTYQMVWEEPAPSEGSESDTTLIEPSEEPEGADEESGGRSPSPMGKVKTKLAAWSWAREQQDKAEDSESGSRPVLSLMLVDTDRRRERSEDHPYAPPNTEKHSASSSARHSGLQTPHEQPEVIAEEDDDVQQADDEAEVDEEDEQPMELRFKSAFHRIRSLSMPASTDYLTVPGRMLHSTSPSSPTAPHAPPSGLPRAMSNLAAEEARFMSHRDSLDLNHHRIEREARMNQLLMTTRDSFVLAKTKYEAKYPKTAGGITYNRFGGLSTIPDASPPEEGREGFAALERRVEGGRRAVSEGAVKADGHIKWAGEKKAEKPRWYKARYMKGEGGVLNLVLLDEEVSE